MEAVKSKTLRKPPPPPPRRHQGSSSETPAQFHVSTSARSCEESSLDSGISTSSSLSSLPSTASLEITVNDQDTSDYSRNFNSTAVEEDSPLLGEISLALTNSSLTSVLSLPPELTVNDEESALEPISTSLTIPRKAAPKPPVRRDSIRSDAPKRNRISSKYNLEERFSTKFHPVESFPPPSPLSNCQKTYPTKELFGEQTEDKEELNGTSKQELEGNSKSRRSDSVFSKMFSLKTNSASKRASVSPKPNVTLAR